MKRRREDAINTDSAADAPARAFTAARAAGSGRAQSKRAPHAHERADDELATVRSHKPADSVDVEDAPRKRPRDAAQKRSSSARRFLLFLGRLPFHASREAILRHFEGVVGEEGIVDLRLMTPRATADDAGSSAAPLHRGCGFIELANEAALTRALMCHHTRIRGFPNPINVELTAGGGGKSQARMQRIASRNADLARERAKRHARIAAQKPHEGQQAEHVGHRQAMPTDGTLGSGGARRSFGSRPHTHTHTREHTREHAPVPARRREVERAPTDGAARESAAAPKSSRPVAFRGGRAFAAAHAMAS